MSLHAAWLFIPWSFSWDWSDFSPFHDHKRASRVLIGQLVMTWSSLLPIGQRSLFNTTPSFPDSSFQSGWTTTKISSGRTLLRPTTIWPNGSNEVWPRDSRSNSVVITISLIFAFGVRVDPRRDSSDCGT